MNGKEYAIKYMYNSNSISQLETKTLNLAVTAKISVHTKLKYFRCSRRLYIYT